MPNETYTVGYSKLGHITQLYSHSSRSHGFELWVWVPFGCSESRKQVISGSFGLVKPAHTTFHIKWFDHYVAQTTTAQFQSGSWDSNLIQLGSGSIVGTASSLGTGSTPSGSIYESGLIDLGDDYDTYNWMYDWVVSTRNRAYCDLWTRSGATSDLSGESWASGSVTTTIPSGSIDRFHQYKFTEYASGSGDFKFHQFTVKAHREPLYIL